MNLLLEILLVALLIKTMGLSAVIIWTLYVVSKILGQLYIMWEEGLKQVFLIHYKKKTKKR
ncbi:hypothetical protein K9M74_03270 [Candidatus Woesearchaeota archaeon]|nr:hypothetical protein [Candidatus Woesearchaeota archaeon]